VEENVAVPSCQELRPRDDEAHGRQARHAHVVERLDGRGLRGELLRGLRAAAVEVLQIDFDLPLLLLVFDLEELCLA